MLTLSNLFLLILLVAAALDGTSVAAFSASPRLNPVQKFLLKIGRGKNLREEVVSRYFDGVRTQNREQIVSCFHSSGTTIRDVCGVSNTERLATPDELGERCMEFLAAHPDTKVMFHYKPTCGRGKSKWVYAHWYEEGTWSGKSRGIEPDGSALDVEGQTRFFVDDSLKITSMVVTRTFSKWEKKLQGSTTAGSS
mmetsp:Transcript_13573/g.25505  ORF Transcript_13573/g.25505 Transcript_13573/m.25505 type:complete len:195 (+) Transcript_13573:75-659(+)